MKCLVIFAVVRVKGQSECNFIALNWVVPREWFNKPLVPMWDEGFSVCNINIVQTFKIFFD